MSYERVAYPAMRDPRLHAGHVIVEPLDEPQAQELAPEMLDLIVAAYSRQFEGPGGPLRPGTFADYYNSRDPSVVRRARSEMIPPIFAQGGNYSAIFDPRGSLIASLKARPNINVPPDDAEARFNGMAELGEILVNPRHQNRLLGTILLHAYFGYQEVPTDARVMLSAFEDNTEINAWYLRLRFRREAPAGEFRLGNLPMRYYVTPEGVGVASIVRYLENQHPKQLRGARVL